MRRILTGLIMMALVGAAVGSGVFALFSDVESSSGNVFQAGTLDLITVREVTVKLHPSWGQDGTHPQQHNLPGGQRTKLALSDDDWYTTVGMWDTSYSDSKYLDFEFPDIPSYAEVTGVMVRVEWARRQLITGAQLKVYDGSTWSAAQGLTLPSWVEGWGPDYTEEKDFSSFIDSPDKVNALKVRFQAKALDGKPEDKKTRHDLVELEVTYTVSAPNPLLTLAQMKPSEPQAVIISLSNAGTIGGVAKLHIKNLVGGNVGTKTEPELTDEDPAGPYVEEVVAAGDIDHPQKWIEITMKYGEATIDLSGYESATDKNTFVDVSDIASQLITLGSLPAGETRQVELTFHLDPYDETGNVFRSDDCSFDIEAVLEQSP